MMKLFFSMLLIFNLASTVSAELNAGPDFVLLSNRFIELEWVGDFVIALSETGVTVLRWDYSVPKLDEIDHLVLPSPANSMKYTTIGLVVRHINDDLSFINPNFDGGFILLGTVSPPAAYSDFAIVSDNIYMSRWFDGIDKYSLSNFTSLDLEKTDKSGVVMTTLESAGDFLYGLDLYNGILKYDLGDGFGPNVTKWVLNERKTSFDLLENTVLLFGNDTAAVVGDFYDDSVSILGEIHGIQGPQRVRGAGRNIVFMSERKVTIADLESLSVIGTTPLKDKGFRGDVRTVGDSSSNLILPNFNGGISLSYIHTLSDFQEVLERPGPINTAIMHNNYLFTEGKGNRLEVYEVANDSILPPILIPGEYKGLADMAKNGDDLFALFANDRKVMKFDISNPADCQLTREVDISILDASQLEVADSLLLVVGKEQIEWFHELNGHGIWIFESAVVDVEMIQNSLYITDVYGKVSAYVISSDISIQKCAERNLTGTGWAMSSYNNKLFVFVGNTLTPFSNCLQRDTIVLLPNFVLDASVAGDTLYTVGPDGVAKYALAGGMPVLIESGGLKGSRISADNGIIATTDGGSINLYLENSNSNQADDETVLPSSTVLSNNYPNPFNASTNISFELATASNIELTVYNSLGQQVICLTNQKYSPGKYSVSWEGKRHDGKDVASGVYYYRLVAEEETVSKKMLLLK